MARRKDRNVFLRMIEKLQDESKLPPETKTSVFAVLLIGFSALLVLARLEKAGPAGAFGFRVLNALFGWGFYLLPVVAFAVAVLFLMSREKKFVSITFAGAALSIIFLLGLIDLLFPERGGALGSLIGWVESPFGHIAALVLLAMFSLAALLVTFHASLILPRRSREEKSRSKDVEPIIAKGSEPEQEEDDDDEEKNEEDEPDTENDDTALTIMEPARAPEKTALLTEHKDYVAPPLSLLASSVEKPTSGDLRANANIIKRTLESFGVPVEMSEISIGPKVTRYTLKPAEGVKLAKITALNQDLALSLAAHPIRIEAPIPGKSLVGIEVPNKAAAIVRLGSLMAYKEFNASGPLGFPLGRDVSGEPIFADIERMPHLLVAGSTGSGKSIAIHSILTSLLYKNSPQMLKLILIDPKRVELSVYEGIPHLVSPVITDAKKSVGVFRWAIAEMERRYETLLTAGSRDIKSYNKGRKAQMPYLVFVVDEMADLMARYGREVEGSVVRLAQMARATGIHLIVSTQRPSVEVVTGLIKANITSRIALQVASQVDSRTILDTAGAEKLLGGGDLLFISSEHSKPKRIQCSYVSEEEIKKVSDFIRDKNEASDTAALPFTDGNNGAPAGSGTELFGEDDEDGDELYDEAVTVVRDAKKASASLLQRRLKVGYARAARLLDLMEKHGVIGPGEGAKPRDILIE